MDNLTHTLTGLMLSRAGLDRWCPNASWILVLAANAPDADAVSAFGGSLTYLQYHRHFTHSLAFIPVMAFLTVVVVRFLLRRRVPWGRALVLAAAGVLSHLILDWTNVYGVRLLLPFSSEWFRLDITHVVDIWIWMVLVAAVLWPPLARLVSSEIGARQGSGRALALAALSMVAFYDLGRLLLHQRAVATLDARMYAGAAPARVAALPDVVNPLSWVGLVETASFYSAHTVNLAGEFDPEGGRILYKPEPSPALEAARSTETFRKYLQFAQYPAWRVVPADEPENGTRVEVRDLRFSVTEPRFVATAVLDSGLRVQRQWFEFGTPGPRR